jgi:hypothetical protein
VLKKNQHIEGPITHAFADRFIVVQGTKGSIDDQKKIDGLTKEFVDAWDENYYGKCRFETDVNISQQDIQNFHLILIGNAKTNLLINRIIGHIPLEFDAHKLTIGDRHYEGENKSIHFIYPNPLNPEKYIVIIGGYHIEKIGLGETDLALKGWYDYTVWQHYPSGNSRIIEGGIFNRYWR